VDDRLEPIDVGREPFRVGELLDRRERSNVGDRFASGDVDGPSTARSSGLLMPCTLDPNTGIGEKQ